jgi:hypothetical protein
MRNRLWNIVAVMLMVAIAAGGWFLGVDPQLAAARTADEQRETVEAQNEATSRPSRRSSLNCSARCPWTPASPSSSTT